jgi:hypothetical protein
LELKEKKMLNWSSLKRKFPLKRRELGDAAPMAGNHLSKQKPFEEQVTGEEKSKEYS